MRLRIEAKRRELVTLEIYVWPSCIESLSLRLCVGACSSAIFKSQVHGSHHGHCYGKIVLPFIID